jgi:hypothetical protein
LAQQLADSARSRKPDIRLASRVAVQNPEPRQQASDQPAEPHYAGKGSPKMKLPPKQSEQTSDLKVRM